MASTLHIFTAQPSPRHRYIFQWFAQRMGLDMHLCGQDERPGAGWQIWYDGQPPGENWQRSIWIKPHGLLEEMGIGKWATPLGRWNELPTLFPQENGSLPFDVFAASFFLISRYEEYWPHRRDAYDRYDFRQSVAAREGFLQWPLVDAWLHECRQWVAANRPDWPPAGATALPHRHSFDLDIAFRLRGQPWSKLAYHLASHLLKFRWQKLAETWRILRGQQIDDFDVLSWLNGLHEPLSNKPRFYLLLSRRNHGYDKNVSPKAKAFRRLVASLQNNYPLGLHPSWEAGEDPKAFEREASAYAGLGLGKPLHSRYHYLHFQLPHGYRQLLAAGMAHDASMGYGEANGFRASTAQPFDWYDLLAEQETKLLVHPFGFMDANAIFEEKWSPEAAQEQLATMMAACERCGVGMEAVWHNHFLTEAQHGGWRALLEWYTQQLMAAQEGKED